MLFNSIEFFIFFPIVTVLYFLSSGKKRLFILFLASCYFYMFFIPVYILILFATIIVDYLSGICIARAKGKQRTFILVISLASNIGFLAFFKYFNFFNINLEWTAGLFGLRYIPLLLSVALPVGLSFHTFQAMSYTIEVYRRHVKPERNLLTYALYVMFYPQLVAGPIERPMNLLPQLRSNHAFKYNDVVAGMRLMAWGFFKKMVIADRFAIFANRIFDHSTSFDGVGLFIGIIAFSFQIYCDFSGYTDIARGAARVMGINLMINFKKPYFAESIDDFWKRWHISLSSWFRDYLYIPLGGSRKGMARTFTNLLVVFFVSGMWHGASWTFGAWGLMHGILLILSRFATRLGDLKSSKIRLFRLPKPVKIAVTFILVSMAWVFFRAKTIVDALYFFSHLWEGWIELLTHLFDLNYLNTHVILGFSKIDWGIAAVALFTMLAVEFRSHEGDFNEYIVKLPATARWIFYSFLLLAIIFWSNPTSKQFIYFQF